MPEPKRPLKVFLCHAHADRDAVRALYTRLTQDGVDAWLDKAKLLPGQDWELEIRKAVREADVVVVCLSKQFNQAGFRQKEVRLALDTAMEKPEGEIFIIPARLEECDNLESLRKWHWVDLFEEDGYEMLMRALRARANRIGVTLQVKKRWLPKISNSREMSINEKKPVMQLDNASKDTANEQIGITNQEKINQEIQRERERVIKKAKRDLWWGKLKIEIKYRLEILRIYRVPIIFLFIALAFIIPLAIDLSKNVSESSQLSIASPAANTNTVSPTSNSVLKNETLTVTSTLTLATIQTPTPTPLPTEITDAKGVSMVLVPAGEFIMGNDSGEYYSEDAVPSHIVYLDSYYIDKFEVTNALYKLCVVEGTCEQPYNSDRYWKSSYSNHPVAFVDWNQANTYCAWRDARLPTEAEWEKAARGTDGRTFPWGEEFDCEKANMAKAEGYHEYCVGDTTAVGSYEIGKSPYGVYDMAGNVWEWVSDWYSENYYQNSPLLNPEGPVIGTERVRRGSSLEFSDFMGRTFYRSAGGPNSRNYVTGYDGFRCAKDVAP